MVISPTGHRFKRLGLLVLGRLASTRRGHGNRESYLTSSKKMKRDPGLSLDSLDL